MVANSATRLACQFQRTDSVVMTANNMKPQGRRRRTGTPSLRGVQGRSATGQDGQAAKEELSAIWGLDAGKLFLAFRRGEVFFT
jgi:hypothetical protein